MSKVAFIGLGVMGSPMAGHLVRAGHAVTVFNRTQKRAAAWCAAHGGTSADTPAAAADSAEAVFVCVGNDDDVREVLLGTEGAVHGMQAGSIAVDHTTTSAAVARELAEALSARGLGFIDAPVSGGQAGAEKGTLTVMCGGTAEAFSRAEALISAYARACVHLGPSGAGQLTKMVNQICVANVIQGLAEALNFGQRAGLDMGTVLETIGQGAAQSWQMDNRGLTMCEGRYDFGFAVDLMRKDLGIVLAEAQRNGAELPVTKQLDAFYAEVQALGGGRWDTSALIERLRRS